MTSTSRNVLSVAAGCAMALLTTRADASYTCKVVDVPQATGTQLWQLNDAGSVAASSSLGAYVYSSGAWSALPPAPGYLPENLGVLGINNSSVMTGPARSVDGAQGFILSGSDYSFFSYAGHTATEPRAISNSGIVTGVAYDSASPWPGVGFVYNPTGAPGYPAGFTEIVPELPDGTRADSVIPGMMNDVGQMVGSAEFAGSRYAFLYDPSWQAHGYAQLITLFRVDGRYTAARGINEKGYVAGFTRDASGVIVGFLLTDQGRQLIDCSASIAGAVETFGESINDDDIMSGIWTDTAGGYHGFIAYPDVVLPVASSQGAFVFDVAVSPGTPVFLDPEPAVGYRYAVGPGDPLFASVTLPIGIGDNAYTLLVGGRAFALAAGERFDFEAHGVAGGVAAFAVLGIETEAALDPADPQAFVTQVTFGSAGRFAGSMAPMTADDELADLRAAAAAAAAAARAGMGIVEKVRRAEDFYARGKLDGACKALADFVFDVNGKADKRISATVAEALVAEASAVRQAVGCR